MFFHSGLLSMGHLFLILTTENSYRRMSCQVGRVPCGFQPPPGAPRNPELQFANRGARQWRSGGTDPMIEAAFAGHGGKAGPPCCFE